MNFKQKQIVTLMITGVLGIGGYALTEIEAHKESKRQKEREDLLQRSDAVVAEVTNLNHILEQKLETAKFWDIVTRNQ